MLLPLALLIATRSQMLKFTDRAFFNGDAAVANMMTRDMAHGRFTTIFYGQTYPGSIESIFALPFYLLWGADPYGFACGQIVLFSLIVLAVYRIGFQLGGRAGALVGSMTMAIGSLQLLENMSGTHQGYMATLLLGALLTIAGYRLLEAATIPRAMLVGLISGIGFWTTPMIVIFLAPIMVVFFLRGQLCYLIRRGELRETIGDGAYRWLKIGLVAWLLLLWGVVEISFMGGFELSHLSLTKYPRYMIRTIAMLVGVLGLLEFKLMIDRSRFVKVCLCAGAAFILGVSPLIHHRLQKIKPVKNAPSGIDVSKIPTGAKRLFKDVEYKDPAALTYSMFGRVPPHKLQDRQAQAFKLLFGALWRLLALSLLVLLVLYRERIWAMLTLRPPEVTYGTLLLLHAMAQLFVFLTFPERLETRYLEPLWIPYCALLAGIAGWMARRHMLLCLTWAMLVLGFYGIAWFDSYRHLDELPPHFGQEFKGLIVEMQTHGNLTRGYANFWIGYPMTALSDEKVILTCFIKGQRENQHMRFKKEVAKAREVVYIFEDDHVIDDKAKKEMLELSANQSIQIVETWRYLRFILYRVRR